MQSLSAQGASRSLPALQYANESFEDDFDWLLHVDDDTYVVLSELVPFLKQVQFMDIPSHLCFRLVWIVSNRKRVLLDKYSLTSSPLLSVPSSCGSLSGGGVVGRFCYFCYV
mmetsp:Transcript_51516/g.70177  ORF Transcript_51516/g.70177 Transcript_51516/m.70177 type:complete len:112 (-) Transcript_51516:1369-1704(-)